MASSIYGFEYSFEPSLVKIEWAATWQKSTLNFFHSPVVSEVMSHQSFDLSHDLQTSRARAAYLHVPFCQHRCGYCNFTLIANRDDLIDKYLKAVDIELQELGKSRRVETLFIGGGTPTYLSPTPLQKLLDLANGWFPLEDGGEFSVEANPGDITEQMAEMLSHAGVTRVSLGAQSFTESKLRRLDRTHSEADIANAVFLLKKHELDISIDLIFGAPDETLDVWKMDLQKALNLEPDHLSTYGLTYEKGAIFYNQLLHGTISRVAETLELQMYEYGIDTLEDAGFDHYEISNFSRPGHRCRHNEGYWKIKSYFAIGAGASRFINGTRETNHRSTTTYIKKLLSCDSPVAFREHLSAEASAREAVVFGLRRMEGISLSTFRASTGFDITTLLDKPLSRFLTQGLLTLENNQLKLTRKGLFISDSLWPEFLSE